MDLEAGLSIPSGRTWEILHVGKYSTNFGSYWAPFHH